MGMTQMGAEAETRTVIGRFAPQPDEVLIQDPRGMTFRTFHFDGVVRVPGYVQWLGGCEMRETYAFHRGVLRFVEIYPNAKFLWSHRNPAKSFGCGVQSHRRRTANVAGGSHQMGDGFRRKFGGDRIVDTSFADLQTEPVSTVARSYARLGLTYSDTAGASVHNYNLADYALPPGHVRKASGNYLGTYDASA
jgi:Sulfotransferase family